MAFKRKRVYAPRRNGAKKRKTFKRRMRRGGKAIADYTSLNTKGTIIGFRGRKTSRRAFKKHLWYLTLFKPHYRSIFTVGSDISMPTNDVAVTIFGLNMYKLTTDPFWVVAGGLLAIDTGITPPLFSGDIILRGGVYTVTFANLSSNDIKLRLWVTKSVPDPAFTLVPSSASLSWDPSCSPDFNSQVGKVYDNRTVTIEGGNSYSFSKRFNVQKIDQVTYTLEGNSPIIYAAACNMGNSTANTLRVVKSYNLSFSADSIGTT